MDRTKEFFKSYFHMKERIRVSRLQRNYSQTFGYTNPIGNFIIPNEQTLLEPLAIKEMSQAFNTYQYNLIADDICRILDIEDRYFRNNILPEVSYITAPKYSGAFFNRNISFPFWMQRYYKWKKTFINAQDFQDFLVNHISILYKEVKDNNEVEKRVPIDANIAHFLITSKDVKLMKLSSIKDLILHQKLNEFKRKTLNDIKIYEEGLNASQKAFYEERFIKERSVVQRLTVKDLDFKVYTKEVNDYLSRTPHQKLEINLTTNERPTVLYLFLTPL